MKVATFYADAPFLPARVQEKSAGFNWHQAIRHLAKSARKYLNAETFTVTDEHTKVECPYPIRVGDAMRTGLMLWLLQAQAAAIWQTHGNLLMVSPDTLIAGKLDMLFGEWDVCLLTRERPTPIINSVIAVRPSAKLALFWSGILDSAKQVTGKSAEWGVDVDAVVDAFQVKPSEDTIREVNGLRVRLLPITGVFESVKEGRRPQAKIWDFKGFRKRLMPQYAAML